MKKIGRSSDHKSEPDCGVMYSNMSEKVVRRISFRYGNFLCRPTIHSEIESATSHTRRMFVNSLSLNDGFRIFERRIVNPWPLDFKLRATFVCTARGSKSTGCGLCTES